MRDHTKKYEKGRISFYRHGWGKPRAPHLTYQMCGYGDSGRPQIHIAFLFWSLFWEMSWFHEEHRYSGINSPQYGIYWYQEGWQSQSFVICMGSETKHIEMPWNLDHVRHSIMLKDETWVHSIKGDKKDFYKDEWKKQMWTRNLPFVDLVSRSPDLNVVDAKLTISEREWRMRRFKWTKLFSKTRKTVNVDFSGEVGRGRGGWKGGTIGTGESLDESENWLDGYEKLCKRQL